jgi:hypothetical protein
MRPVFLNLGPEGRAVHSVQRRVTDVATATTTVVAHQRRTTVRRGQFAGCARRVWFGTVGVAIDLNGRFRAARMSASGSAAVRHLSQA